MTRWPTPLEDARQGIERNRPNVIELMQAAIALGERLVAEGRHDDAIVILGALQTLQSDNISLLSALELTAMAAENEQRRLRTKLGEAELAQFNGGYAITPRAAYMDLLEVADRWAQQKAAGDKQRATAARKPRTGLYGDWMKETVWKYGRGRRKPSPKLALDALKTEAAERGWTGPLPSRQAVGKWLRMKKPSDR